MALRGKEKEKDRRESAPPIAPLQPQEEENIIKDEDVMAWKFFSLPQITILLEQDVAGIQKSLEIFLNLKEYKTSLKEAILLDYYVSGYCWAKALDFTPVQLGGFLTLLNLLLENLESQKMTLEENIQELANAVAGIGIGQCNAEQSGGFEFFTVDQAKSIINYLKIRYSPYIYILKKHSDKYADKCAIKCLQINIIFSRQKYVKDCLMPICFSYISCSLEHISTLPIQASISDLFTFEFKPL